MSNPKPWEPGDSTLRKFSTVDPLNTAFKVQAVFDPDSARLNGWNVADLNDPVATARIGESYALALSKAAMGSSLEGEPRMWNTPTTSMVLGPSVPYAQYTLATGFDEPVLPFARLDYNQPAKGSRSGPRSTYSFM